MLIILMRPHQCPKCQWRMWPDCIFSSLASWQRRTFRSVSARTLKLVDLVFESRRALWFDICDTLILIWWLLMNHKWYRYDINRLMSHDYGAPIGAPRGVLGPVYESCLFSCTNHGRIYLMSFWGTFRSSWGLVSCSNFIETVLHGCYEHLMCYHQRGPTET